MPPAGMDPAQCPRAITGIWDDHDYGVNNGRRRCPARRMMRPGPPPVFDLQTTTGDQRYPLKAQVKDLFLDAIGDPRMSPRRGAQRGMQASAESGGAA